MKFHIGETLTPVANLLPIAAMAQQLGYAGFAVSDSICYPLHSETRYSYSDEGGRDFLENKDLIESFVLAAAIGAANPSLEITSSVVKLPVRQPVYAAKLASSVHAITGGRFNFGVGLSVWPEDYSVMGVPYAARGRRFDECLAIVQGLCTGEYFEHHGEFYQFPAIRLNPAAPDMPIFIGGHSDAALRRAARFDGWSAAGASDEELGAMISKLRQYRQDRDASGPFRIFDTYSGDLSLSAVQRRRDLGVTDLIIHFRNIYQIEVDDETIDLKIDRMKRFAGDVMGHFG